MGIKTELVNTRNNTAAFTATKAPSKKILKLVGLLKFYDNILTEHQETSKPLKGVTLDILLKSDINILRTNISWI